MHTDLYRCPRPETKKAWTELLRDHLEAKATCYLLVELGYKARIEPGLKAYVDEQVEALRALGHRVEVGDVEYNKIGDQRYDITITINP